MFRLALLIIIILITSCQQTGLKENSLKNQPAKQNAIHQISYQTNNHYKFPVQESITGNEKEIDWTGSWHFEQDKVKYEITIDEKLKDFNQCIYQVEGIPAFYILECKGVVKGNKYELYYRYTHDGDFLRENKIDRHKPILTLAMENGKVITYWNQLPGGRNGRECFKKKV